MSGQRYNLPSGWTLSKLKAICDINPRFPRDVVSSNTLVSFVPMSSIDAEQGKVTTNLTKPYGKVRKGYTHFANGDVLLAKITPCMENGKVAVAEKLHNNIGCGTTELHVLRPLAGILPQLIFYYVRQVSFRKHAEACMSGTSGHLRVPAKFVEEIDFPLPPLTEQRRIIKKITVLIEHLQKTKELLSKIRPLLMQFRQSILAKAFSGELTKDWRDKQKDLEPASKLLKRIREERKKKLGKKYKEPKQLDTSNLPELPVEWEWARLGDLYSIVGGGTPTTKIAAYWRGKTPWITSADIKGLQCINVRKFITREAIMQSATNPVPASSIIVVTRVGLGKVALTNKELCFSQDCQALLPCRYLFAEYILWFLARATQLFMYNSRGSTIDGVTKRQVAELAVAIPPYEEQREIVRTVEKMYRHADTIGKSTDVVQSKCNRLTQSIFAKAFRGELVPQDPNDEPADKLLEGIEAAKRQTRIGDRILHENH